MLSKKFLSSKKIFSHLFNSNLLKNANKLDKQYSNLIDTESKKKDSNNKFFISNKRKRIKPLFIILNNNNNKIKNEEKIKNECEQKIKKEFKSESESESDSVSISFSEQDEKNNKTFSSNNIISNILNYSELIIENKNNLDEIIKNINLNKKELISYNNNHFYFIKIKSLHISRDFSYAIFLFYQKIKKNKCEECENILYKINSQNEEDFIDVIQKMIDLNSYIKCELIIKNISSKNNNNSIINNMQIFFLKNYYF